VTGRILVLRAAGQLGRVAAEAFRDAGWEVTSLVRPGAAGRAATGTSLIELDALDHAAVADAARGCDIVLHALNVPYTAWSRHALPLAWSAINAAQTADATLMLVGNMYNYGSPLPPLISETTPMRPSSSKGRLSLLIEDGMQEGAERGLRSIILRAGDFLGGGRGSWLDLVIVKDLAGARLTYPGPIDLVHEWAYLPDLALTLVRLAALRERLQPFATFGFPGHAFTGRELTTAIARTAGRGLRVRRMSWWLIHALSPFVPLSRELSEIAYLWQQPHRIDGSRLHAMLGEVPHTPLDQALARTLQELAAPP
jgi:nucleoside-diphosphate-sugar epimerase